MSAHRFDELTKALATAKSRRQALKILAAGIAGGVLVPGTAQAAGEPRFNCCIVECAGSGTGAVCTQTACSDLTHSVLAGS